MPYSQSSPHTSPRKSHAGLVTLVTETHAKSLEARKKERLNFIASKPWPSGPWGDSF